MAKSHESPGVTIRKAWDRLHGLPGGRWLFSKFVGWTAPYSGSIGARIVDLKPGHVVAELKDRRAVRNHLNSVHAIALVNLGEITSGLAMLTALPDGVRGIVTGLDIEYIKKARGRLMAESKVEAPTVTEKTEVEALCEIRDVSGDIVAKARVRWLLSPPKSRHGATQEVGAAQV